MFVKIFSKKDNGIVVATVIETTLCILFCTIILLFSLSFMSTIQRKSDVDLLCRKYILLMETEGCMTVDMENNFKSELDSLGVTQIDLTGTTKSTVANNVETKPTNYGEVITLHIKGKITVPSFIMNNDWGKISTMTLDMDITKSSISKE